MHISQKCSIAVHCLLFINEYEKQANVTSTLLSMSTGCNPVVIRSILSKLKKAGIIDGNQGTGNARLVKKLDDITLYDIFMVLEPKATKNLIGIHPSPSKLCPVGRNIHSVLEKSYEKISIDLEDSLRKVTLSSIAVEFHKHLSEETSQL